MKKIHTGIIGTGFVVAACVALYLWKYQEWIAIPHAREPWVSHLRDPSSAQFRNERISKAGALCGEVNAKNGMGGYVGFKKFIAYGPESNYVEDDGVIGNWSTADIVAKLDKQIELMKMYNDWRSKGLDIPKYSEGEMDSRAAARLFQDKWAELCEQGKA